MNILTIEHFLKELSKIRNIENKILGELWTQIQNEKKKQQQETTHLHK